MTELEIQWKKLIIEIIIIIAISSVFIYLWNNHSDLKQTTEKQPTPISKQVIEKNKTSPKNSTEYVIIPPHKISNGSELKTIETFDNTTGLFIAREVR